MMSDFDFASFDASTEPESDFAPIPKGVYPTIVTKSEFKPTSKGTGEFLQFTFEIIDGEYKGRLQWARLNLKNPNETAVGIARRELAQICKAVGILRPHSSSELHGKPLLIYVDIEVSKETQEPQNVIKKYESMAGGTKPAVTSAAAQYAPPAPAAAQSTAPWKQ